MNNIINKISDNIKVGNICIGLSCMLLTGCIKNDVPYPQIQQDILSISAQGESSPAVINTTNLTATISLDEDVDITKVKFTDFTYTEGAECSKDLLDGTYDLTRPISVTLSKYQSYQWIIEAEQNIERYFTISGQVGETIMDIPGHRIVISVPENMSLSSLEVSSVKLGPANITTMTPEVVAGERYNFSSPFHITVTYNDVVENWTVYVRQTDVLVSTTSADAWSQVIWVYGAAADDAENGFEYRKSSDTEWIKVPESYITHSSGSFSAYIPHLTPLTEYVVRAYSDDNTGNEITVTTGATTVLPDGSFDQWWLDNKVWCPWNEGGTQFWDTGNTGAATLGNSNVVPSDDTPNGSGQSAKLETRFVGISVVGKLAAGSIYSGVFSKVDGTNGILDFGKPWTERPTKLKGYYKYTTAPINYASTEYQDLLGRPDTCHIYIALTDWTEPYQIRTNPKNRQLFDKNSSAVIAYGELLSGSSTNGWQEFEITLNYRSTSRKPSYILITSAASKYGDFFTGGTGAVLYVDQYSLSYDY